MTGFVYLATSDAMPKFVKIGMAEDVDARMRQLSAETSAAMPFICRCKCETTDPANVERQLHEFFRYCRVNQKKEFFAVDWRAVAVALLLLCQKSESKIAKALCPDDAPPDAGITAPALTLPAGNLRENAVRCVSAKLNLQFGGNGTTRFADGRSKCLVCLITNTFHRAGRRFWFSVTPRQKESMEQSEEAWISFACRFDGQPLFFLIPWRKFSSFMDRLGTTMDGDAVSLWHVFILPDGWVIHTAAEYDDIPIEEYALDCGA